jgi:hypothetical protein
MKTPPHGNVSIITVFFVEEKLKKLTSEQTIPRPFLFEAQEYP